MTNPLNPYLAPAAALAREPYVPLGWRTRLLGFTTALVPLFTFLKTVAGSFIAKFAQARSQPYLQWSQVAVFLCILACFGAMLVSAVVYGIWIHRAAWNVRGLGRSGTRFSPAFAVVAFYLPLVCWILRVLVVSELWRASTPGPEGDGRGWSSGSVWLAVVWSLAWILGFVALWASLNPHPPRVQAMDAFAATALLALSAYAWSRLMKGIDARQRDAAARLTRQA